MEDQGQGQGGTEAVQLHTEEVAGPRKGRKVRLPNAKRLMRLMSLLGNSQSANEQTNEQHVQHVHACTCRSKDHVTSARASATGGGRYGEIRFADSEIEIVQEGRLALLLPLQPGAGRSIAPGRSACAPRVRQSRQGGRRTQGGSPSGSSPSGSPRSSRGGGRSFINESDWREHTKAGGSLSESAKERVTCMHAQAHHHVIRGGNS